jgi:Fe2+ or Zn2+ uptake regulation protein
MTRKTVQQSIIENALHELGNHPTADQVFERVSAAYPSISRATVYRTLNKLAENGSALKIPIADAADRFDHRADPHFHVLCTKCGHVSDVSLCVPERLLAQAGEESGFKVDSVSLLFSGICPNCAQLEAASSA